MAMSATMTATVQRRRIASSMVVPEVLDCQTHGEHTPGNGRLDMKTTRLIVVLCCVLGLSISLASLRAQQGGGSVAIDNDDIGGVVTGARGPEAGVWVIAETRDTPTRLVKIVVTNDQGRYVIPDLPRGTY